MYLHFLAGSYVIGIQLLFRSTTHASSRKPAACSVETHHTLMLRSRLKHLARSKVEARKCPKELYDDVNQLPGPKEPLHPNNIHIPSVDSLIVGQAVCSSTEFAFGYPAWRYVGFSP